MKAAELLASSLIRRNGAIEIQTSKTGVQSPTHLKAIVAELEEARAARMVALEAEVAELKAEAARLRAIAEPFERLRAQVAQLPEHWSAKLTKGVR